MTDQQKTWSIYFAGLVSMRMHPRNIPNPTPAATEHELQYCYDIANRMLDLHQDRWGPTVEEL